MMKEWATVIAWQEGMATLHAEKQTSCNSCSARKSCGSHLLNSLVPSDQKLIHIAHATPLQSGQRVELGIPEASLLGSALLIYMAPLAGLFAGAALFQLLFMSDLAAVVGALTGGIGGFLLAKGATVVLEKRKSFQPVILNVALPTVELHTDVEIKTQ